MKKRSISVVMAILILICSITSAGCSKRESVDSTTGIEISDEAMTREQWIMGLGAAFGMNEYVTEQPFFSDVDVSSELFPYLQSCAEWGIFEKTGGDFEPQQGTTREYAIQTAVIASEVLNDSTEDNLYEECISYAEKKGILESDKKDYLSESITYEEGQKILDWAVWEYQNKEFVEYSDVQIREDIIDMTACNLEVNENENTVIIPKGDPILQEGDVFITPATKEAPYGVAEKVVSVSYDDEGKQIVETTDPELEEIYEKLDFAVRAVPEVEDIVVSEGVTLASADAEGNAYVKAVSQDNADDVRIETLSYANGNKGASNKGANFGFEVNFTKGSVKLNPSWESSFGQFKAELDQGTQSVDKEAGVLFEKSNVLYESKGDYEKVIDTIDNKFTGGYEITGSVAIKDLYIDVEAHPKKLAGIPVGIDTFSITTNYKTESTLKLKGTLKEELKLSSFHIQTPVPGLTVKVEVMLYANANGELEVKLNTSNVNTLSYSDGRTKKVNTSTADSLDFKAAIEIECGAAVKAAPCILGIEIVDVKLKVAVKYNFSQAVSAADNTKEKDGKEITTRTWNWEVKIEKTLPVVTMEVGSGKKCLLKLNFKWELVGSKGLIKIESKPVYDRTYCIGESVINSIDLNDATEAESTEPNVNLEQEPTESSGILEKSEILDIDIYMLSLGVGDTYEIQVTDIPEGYNVSDLVWESDDTEIVTVKDGKVKAVSVGNAQVKVATSDGKHSISCTVIVGDKEEVEFHSL